MSNVIRIPAFNDNYFWLMSDNKQQALIVDPGDAQVVMDALQRRNLDLTDILITHHHADHIGGVDQLLKQYPNANVFGPATSRFDMVTHPCSEGDVIYPKATQQPFSIVEVPGHTSDHIAYYSAPILFVGDTLFSSGCGRLFEGTAEQMLTPLKKLVSLPLDTQIYCAHEYTYANAQFAIAALPNNKTIQDFLLKTAEKRRDDKATVPTSLATELTINPFLLCHTLPLQLSMQKQFGLATLPSELETFTYLRKWKDVFQN